MDAILIYNGLPVKLETEKYKIKDGYKEDENGILYEFEIGHFKYSFFTRNDFFPNDLKRDLADGTIDYALDGYYNIEYFSIYRRGNSNIIDLHKSGFFDISNFEAATEGDIVTVKRLDPKAPFNEYYYNKIYKFKIKYSLHSNTPNYYKTINDFPIINSDINSPNYSVVTHEIHSSVNSFRKEFYFKNFGSFIQNWTLPDELSNDDLLLYDDEQLEWYNSKKNYAKLMTKICWNISHIYKDILPILAIFDVGYIVLLYSYKHQFTLNPETTDQTIIDNAEIYDGLPIIDKTIAEILYQWGYFKIVDYPAPINDFPSTFTQVSSYSEMQEYLNSLTNLYESIRYYEESILFPVNNNNQPVDEDGDILTDTQDSERRVKFLIGLSTNALTSLPFTSRLNLLKDFVKRKELAEEEQRTVVKLLKSFIDPAESDGLMEYLLALENGVNTNFELLYNKLDDARLERYSFIQWVADGKTNRKTFIYILYEVWKISKYNSSYIPILTAPNQDNLNPSAYFLNDGQKYFITYDSLGNIVYQAEFVLEYSFVKNNDAQSNIFFQVLSTEVRYETEKLLNKEKVIINRYNLSTVSTYTPSPVGGGIPGLFPSPSKPTKYGEYHIYQPITLMGYEADLELVVPQFTPIPAFLFYYAIDFDKIKDFDANLNFALELAVEIGLFFATGGVGNLRHFGHVFHITKIGRALKGSLQASEAVIVWRGLQVGGEVLSLSAGVLYSCSTYIANTTNDQATYNLAQKLGKFFLVITFASVGGSIYGRYKAVKSADEVLKEIDELTGLGIPHGLEPDVIDILYTIRNTANVSKVFFNNRIASLTFSELGESNHISALYDGLSSIEKSNFWRQFADKVGDATSNPTSWNIDDIAFWKKMNKTEEGISAIRMKAWIEVPYESRFLRRHMDFLDDYVTFVNKNDGANWKHINEIITADGGTRFLAGHTKTNFIKASGNEVASGNFNGKYIEIDVIPSTGTNITTITKKTIHPLNHVRYEERGLFYRYPTLQPSSGGYILNGMPVKRLKVSFKTKINPNWSEERTLHEHVFAIFTKEIDEITNNGIKYGRNYPQIKKVYVSRFSDGTEVEIVWHNYEKLGNQIIDDHYYIEILFENL